MFWRSFVVSVRLVVALGGAGLLLIGSLEAVRAATTVTLAWDPSGTPGIAGYRLYYGTSSGSYSNSRNIVGGIAGGNEHFLRIAPLLQIRLEILRRSRRSFGVHDESVIGGADAHEPFMRLVERTICRRRARTSGADGEDANRSQPLREGERVGPWGSGPATIGNLVRRVCESWEFESSRRRCHDDRSSAREVS